MMGKQGKNKKTYVCINSFHLSSVIVAEEERRKRRNDGECDPCVSGLLPHHCAGSHVLVLSLPAPELKQNSVKWRVNKKPKQQ